MPIAYKAELLYTTFKDEAHALEQSPFVKRDPILVDCPCDCGVKYALVEDAHATIEEIEADKQELIRLLKNYIPVHPDKVKF